MDLSVSTSSAFSQLEGEQGLRKAEADRVASHVDAASSVVVDGASGVTSDLEWTCFCFH